MTGLVVGGLLFLLMLVVLTAIAGWNRPRR